MGVGAKMYSGERGGVKYFIFDLCYKIFKTSMFLKNQNHVFVIVNSKYRLVRCFLNRGDDEGSMCHFKEIVFG